MPPPLLLSTDFDGTVLDHDEPAPMAAPFFDWLETARRHRRIVWVINTGRDWGSLQHELEHRCARIWPDWVVLIEREIHRVRAGALEPLAGWNRRCRELHADLFHRAAPALETTRRVLSRHEKHLSFVEDSGSPLGLIAGDNAQAERVHTALAPLLRQHPDLHVVRNMVYFRFAHVDFHKGSCLEAVAREENIPPGHCFAAGDHLNDLAMLDRRYAHGIACPSNADERVRAHVREQRGYVASRPADRGVAEALAHYYGNGAV